MIVSPRFEDSRQRFEDLLSQTLRLIRERCSDEFPSSIFYAYKQQQDLREGRASTGWETMLNAVISAGFQIIATWPMHTEMATRQRSLGSNALASSVVLVCRPRTEDARAATRRQFLDALASELPAALDQLTREGHIPPVDLAQAAIGPGMQVYSRYSRVETISGKPVRVREALAAINQAIAEYYERQEGDLDAETRFCLAWLQQHGFGDGQYGDADTMAPRQERRSRRTGRRAPADCRGRRSAAAAARRLRPGPPAALRRNDGLGGLHAHGISPEP